MLLLPGPSRAHNLPVRSVVEAANGIGGCPWDVPGAGEHGSVDATIQLKMGEDSRIPD